MIGTRLRLALAFLVLVGAVVLVSGGGAGPRLAAATFEAFPGPGQVTYDELIAYKAEFTTRSDSTLTHVRFRQTIPVAGTQPATFDDSTCPSTPTTRTMPDGTEEWICDFGQVPSGTPKLELTIVWRVPTLVDDADGCDGCLVSTGRWTVKEGVNDTTDPNDVFGKTTVNATLLAFGTDAEETLLAGGYEKSGTTSCADPDSPGNLRTNQVISSLTNPVSTKFCLPSFVIPVGDPNLGYATTITETPGNAHGTEVCIAALGTNCGESYVDATFGSPYVTHIFQVAAAALPKNYKITTVSHNGDELTDETCAATGDCVIDIDLDRKTKIWTIEVTSSTNGPWNW
jgi:hypothetical protein